MFKSNPFPPTPFFFLACPIFLDESAPPPFRKRWYVPVYKCTCVYIHFQFYFWESSPWSISSCWSWLILIWVSGVYIVYALLFCDFISKTEHIFDIYLYINQDKCTNINSIPIKRFEKPSLHQGNKQPLTNYKLHGHIPKTTRIILIINLFIYFFRQ